MNPRSLCLAALALPFLAAAGAAQDPVPVEPPAQPAPAPTPRIEVVFALDTTGSMSGLIQSAKDKIWSIANLFALANPAPEVEIGLVAYRDRGDDYVTRITPLSADLDAVYGALMDFQAAGGGDSPESVNQALHEAVTRVGWSDDPGVYRVIFLVGDCPPHMDYEDDVKYEGSCKQAAERGIIINTIQCGNAAGTELIWKDIARRAEGRMFRVDQSGGAVAVATPFDEELAKLSIEIDGTRLWYGNREELQRQEQKDAAAEKIYEESSITAQATRCAFNQGRIGASNWLGGAKELLSDLAAGVVKLEEIAEEELPEALRELKPAARREKLAQDLAKRAELKGRIDSLVAKRRAFLEEQAAKDGASGATAWDRAIRECAEAQTGRFGIRFEK